MNSGLEQTSNSMHHMPRTEASLYCVVYNWC